MQLPRDILPLLLTATAPLLVAACTSTPPDAAGAQSAASFSAAPVLTEAPLPPGQWDTVYNGTQDLRGGTSRRRISISREGDVIDRAVLVYRIALGLRYEFLPRAACSNPAYYYEVSETEGTDRGDCWHVRAVNLGTAGDPHWVNLVLAEYAESGDLYLPAVMVGVRYIRYDEGNLLQIDYLWNADLLLPPPADGVWTPAEWSVEAVAADPAKRAVMQTLRRWGEQWHPQVAASLPFPASS